MRHAWNNMNRVTRAMLATGFSLAALAALALGVVFVTTQHSSLPVRLTATGSDIVVTSATAKTKAATNYVGTLDTTVKWNLQVWTVTVSGYGEKSCRIMVGNDVRAERTAKPGEDIITCELGA